MKSRRVEKQPYEDFYPSTMQVRMCGDHPIVRVRVSETETPTDRSYWAWWDNERQHFTMVYYSRVQVEICFAYGSKAEEARGRGKVCQVDVEELAQHDRSGPDVGVQQPGR